MTRLRRAALAVLLLLAGPGFSQGSLASFLEPLQEHPGLRAARSALDAARAEFEAISGPLQLDVSGGYSLLDVGEVDLAPELPGIQGLDETATDLSTELRLRPFAFGDVADAVDQRRVALEQARLDYLETLTSLQTRALEAAQGVILARHALEVAQEGERLAAEALAATRARRERGAATERELRDANAGLLDANYQLEGARARLDLAERTLASLVGDRDLPAELLLEPPAGDGVPLQVARARLGLRLAELAPRSATRALFPTVQASYTWNLSENDSLSVSLESRTLQPSIGYSYRSPGRTFPQSEIEGTFQIGASLTISPSALDALDAARAQREAAALGLEAAQRTAELQLAGLEGELERATRSVALAQLRLENARHDLEETRQRQEAGLAIPLDVLRASLAVTSADLELRSARQELQRSIHDIYEFYGQPPVPDSDDTEGRR